MLAIFWLCYPLVGRIVEARPSYLVVLFSDPMYEGLPDPLHFAHVQSKSGSCGITLCPQLSQTNHPSTRIFIGRKSSPSLQYGHRMIGEVNMSLDFTLNGNADPGGHSRQ